MLRRAVLPLFVLLGACAAPSSDDDAAGAADHLGTAASPIVGGSPSSAAQDAIVYISIGTGGEFCTGTLITPNLVITARHCVQGVDENATTDCAAYTTRIVPSTMTISLGAAGNTGVAAAVGKQTFVDAGTNMCSHDIGLIQLDRDVAGAKIAPLRFTKVAKGEMTSTVGYGDDGSGTPTSGRYQRASLPIDVVGPASASYTTKANQALPYTVQAGELATGESTCFGDSGGPLLDGQGNIVGLTSRGIDDKCIDRPSIYTDIASHEQLIRDAASTAGHPLAAAAPVATPDSTGSGSGDGTDETGAPSDPSTATKTASKRTSTLTAQPNAGCSAAGAGAAPSSSTFALLGLVALVRLAASRRARRRAA